MRIPALIALGRLDDADAELTHVRTIAPDEPVLAELDEMLAAARAGATTGTGDPPESS